MNETLFDNYDQLVIYKIASLSDHKCYIGGTMNFFQRKRTHLSMLRGGIHYNTLLQNAFNLHGEDSFLFEIIEFIGNNKKLTDREQYWINKLKPEYNIKAIATPNKGNTPRNDSVKTKGFEEAEALCVRIDTDKELIEKLNIKTGIPIERLELMLLYNILTVKQFSQLSGLALGTISNKTKPILVGGKYYSEIDFCYPFRALRKIGPKYIVRNSKSEKYLKG